MLFPVPLIAIEAAFDEFGPIPRLFFDSRVWSSYRKELNIALDNLSLGYLESLSFRHPFAFDDFSQKMLILRHSTIDLDSINLDSPSVYIQLIMSQKLWAGCESSSITSRSTSSSVTVAFLSQEECQAIFLKHTAIPFSQVGLSLTSSRWYALVDSPHSGIRRCISIIRVIPSLAEQCSLRHWKACVSVL